MGTRCLHLGVLSLLLISIDAAQTSQSHVSELDPRQDALALAALCRKKARLLETDLRYDPHRTERVARELARAESLEENPKVGIPILPGLHERAYFSPVDGSVQPWVYYLPRERAPSSGSKWPCIVFLHGYAPMLHEGNWLELMIPQELFEMGEALGWVVLLPFGRGNVDYLGVGERDVMDVLDRAVPRLGLDSRRIVLSGISMGGAGAWCIASHYPDRFAAVMPLAGRSDYFLWRRDPIYRSRLARRYLADLDYLWARRENVLGLPAFLVHSKDDPLIMTEQSTKIHAELERRGSPCKLVLYEKEGHWVASRAFQEKETMRWLKELPPRKRSEVGYFSTFSPDYGQAFGLSIDRMTQWTKKAEIHWNEEPDEILLSARNVAEIQVDLDHFIPPHDNRSLRFSPMPSFTHRSGSKVTVLWEAPEAGISKRPGLSGPIRQVYAEPFLAVFGEGKSEQLYKRFARAWQGFAHGEPRGKKDTRVTEADIERYHLVLFGGVGENLWVKRLEEHLPILWEETTCRVGGRSWKGQRLGLSLVYPSPLKQGKLIVWNAGEIWGLGMEPNHLMDYLPDFVVFAPELERDGSNRVLCSGFFDSQWNLDPALLWVNEKTDDGAAR